MIVVLVMEAITTDEQMTVWGWRVPYFLSLLTSACGIMLRRGLTTPPSHSERLEDLKEGSVVTPPGLARELSSRIADSFSRARSSSTMRNSSMTNRASIASLAGDAHLVAVAEPDKTLPVTLEEKVGVSTPGGAGATEAAVVKVPLWTAIKQGYWLEMLLHNNYLVW
jgi:hypothetical protein